MRSESWAGVKLDERHLHQILALSPLPLVGSAAFSCGRPWLEQVSAGYLLLLALSLHVSVLRAGQAA